MEKKKFIKPEMDIIDFQNNDIITASVGTDDAGWTEGELFGSDDE